MAEVKWIKIVTDIFDDEKIILIEQLPDGDKLIVIWFKLLCLAGKQNNGGVFMLTDRIAYTEEMLAAIFRRPVNTVRLALSTFEQYGMIEIVNGTITVPNWNKHQTLDSFEKKKIRDRIYQQERREAQRELIKKSSDNRLTEGRLSDDKKATVAISDIDKEEEQESISIMSGKPDDLSDKCREIVERLNEKAGTNYRYRTPSTQTKIHARLAEGFTKEDFFTVIDHKCAEWKSDERMSQYLRPETLFGTKFESYLNAAESAASGGGTWAREEQDDMEFYGR